MPGIDDDILKNLEDADPTLKGAAGTQSTDGGEGETDLTAQDTPTNTQAPIEQPGGTTEPTRQPDRGGNKPDTTVKPQASKDGARADGAVPQADGSLKLADGTIIQKGAHRRLYEQKVAAETEVQTIKQHASNVEQALVHIRDNVAPEWQKQVDGLRAKVDAYESAATVGNQLKLTSEEQTYALKLVAAYKANPIETLKYMLAEAKAQGHSIDGIGAGVDTAAINRLIETKMAPITALQEREQAANDAFTNAGKELATFYSQKPDAKLHEEHLAAIMEADPNLSLESAYYELKLAVAAQQLDWSKPLRDQIAARTARTTPADGGNGGGGQRQQQQQSLPNGRPNAGANSTDRPQTFAANAEFSDIIRDSMREAGLRV